MRNTVIQYLNKCINEELRALEESNLKLANEDKYNEFRNSYLELNKRLVVSSLEGSDLLPLEWEYARLSSSFDFYITMFGNDLVVKYLTEELKKIIQGIIDNSNSDNYKLNAKKLDEVMEANRRSNNPVVYSLEIKGLINKFNYQVCKYKLKDGIYDDQIDKNGMLEFVLEDINSIMNDEGIGESLKEVLKKYILYPSNIINDFKQVLIIINLALTKKEVSIQELDQELNREYLNSSDLEKSYTRSEPVSPIDLKNDNLLEKRLERAASISEEELISEFIGIIKKMGTNNLWAIHKFITVYKRFNYSNIKYLVETIAVELKDAFFVNEIKRSFKESGYQITCAIMSQIVTLEEKFIYDYLLYIPDRYVFNYLLKGNREYVINNMIDRLCFRLVSNENLKLLLDGIGKDIKLLKTAIDKFINNKYYSSVIFIYNELDNDIREELEDYFFSIKALGKFSYNITAEKNLGMHNIIDNLDDFGAYYYSNSFSSYDEHELAEYFVKKHYQKKHLDWSRILKLFDDNFIIKEYCYLSIGRDLFLYVPQESISTKFALYMINNHPNSVVDFLEFLEFLDILDLPSITLNIFVNHYEEYINSQGINVGEKTLIELSMLKSNASLSKDTIELLVYIMQKGLINNEILSLFINLDIPGLDIYLNKAISNCKKAYLKPSLFINYYKDKNGIPDNIEFIFLDSRDLESLYLDKEKDLKLKKYYGSLIELLEIVPDNYKLRIIIEINKSGIEEYINYLRTNYREYLDLLLGDFKLTTRN